MEKKISGKFGGAGTPAVGDWDAMHSFSSRSKDGFGGRVNGYGGIVNSGQVSKALVEYYKKQKLNPCVKSIKVTVNPSNWTVEWEVTIGESPDGNAYVGFSSWGGASGGYPKKKPPASHAYTNYKKEVQNAKDNNPGTIIKDVLDLYVAGGFRQIFFQFTSPKKYPNLPKSANLVEGTVGVQIGPSGSPANLPENSGVEVFTTQPNLSTGNNQSPVSGTESNVGTGQTSSTAGSTSSNVGSGDPKTQNAKIKLVKKSGPGEIMGEVEKEVYNGEASFKALQFDQPGDYVISAVSSVPEQGTVDFRVRVEPQPEAPQEPKAAEEEPPIEGQRPVISQIDKPTYILPPIEFDTNRNKEADGSYAKNLGFNPFFWYMGYQIQERDITSLSLYHEGLVPKVRISFNDTLGIMKREGFPLDDTKFQIFMNSGSDNLKFIHMRFKLENFQNNRKGNYTITGTIDLNDFYKPAYKSYTGTSFEALRTVSKELELGFNSNITNTTDSMKWTNTGKLPKEFINEIISHSYISDDSFLIGYIDFNYCFNYVDIEKEWKRDIKNDLNVVSRGIQGALSGEPPTGDEEKLVRLRLTNDASQQATNLYIKKYQLNNASTKQSITKGQFNIAKFYDTFSKSFLIFNIDSLTSEGDKTVILKGAPSDKKELESNYRTQFQGRVDLENVHKNYLYAKIQNKVNFDNLARITVELELPNANFNLYRFQKIEITFINQKSGPTNEDVINTRISGEWIILEIIYNWSGGKMSQNLVCARKELGKLPEEIKEQEVQKDQENNTERNENPTDAPTTGVPNSVYQVGEVYNVRDKNGKEFTLSITEISTNGIDVKATVTEVSSGSETNPNPSTETGATQSVTGTASVGATQSISGTASGG